MSSNEITEETQNQGCHHLVGQIQGFIYVAVNSFFVYLRTTILVTYTRANSSPIKLEQNLKRFVLLHYLEIRVVYVEQWRVVLVAVALTAAKLNINQERRGYVFYSEGGDCGEGAGAVWQFRQFIDTQKIQQIDFKSHF